MKIAVFGSTGGNGRLVLGDGIRRGHEMTAFARDAGALDGVAGLAGVVEGDGRDRDAVDKAIAGQGAVIVTVSGRGEADVVSGITRTVTAAMASLGVSRLVAASAYGMVATKPYIVAGLVRRIFAAGFADQAAADQIIAGSELDWTILRGTRLTAKPAAGPGRRSTELFTRGPYSLPRSAFATALVELAEDRTTARQIVNITGSRPSTESPAPPLSSAARQRP